ncbi:UDP-3-O-acyl-N-acetylglucosamine deacetylase [Lacibacterium aquatile]|uniref:UDP-3-O-acyl-N-acetylglucosamine deacetylase n=1 Tax=Lacibacterium aquatile TaxID=1168082 RepID=A0ABW5DRY3_9PROT
MSDRQRRMSGNVTAAAQDVSTSVRQRTLRNPVQCNGVGLHSGQPVNMTLLPAAPNTGIVFRRTDVAADLGVFPARWDVVAKTMHATLLQNEHGTTLSTVEHLMAALAGLGIDNVTVLVDGPELPIMDGSSEPFVFLMDLAGIVEQNAPRRYLKILRPVEVTVGNKHAVILPSDAFEIECSIDFDASAIAQQSATVTVNETSFRNDIARARTFVRLAEVDALKAHGLAKGGSLDNAVVVDDAAVLNPEGLRFLDEFVRHKVLDCIGDFALAGSQILGRLVAARTGHALNNALVRAIFADAANYTYLEQPAAFGAPMMIDLPAVAAVA